MGIVGIAVVVQSSARSTSNVCSMSHAVDMPGSVWGVVYLIWELAFGGLYRSFWEFLTSGRHL